MPTYPIKCRDGTDDENIVMAIWQRYEYKQYGYDIAPGDVVIDLGAHIGGFSVWAAIQGGIVHSFEPEPGNFALLQENTAPYQNITLYNLGVLDKPGLHKLSVNPRLPAVHSFVMPTYNQFVGVECITLTQVLDMVGGRCDLLKVDVEGAEYGIFLSLPRETFGLIRRIALEWHKDHEAAIVLERLFNKHGFDLDLFAMDTERLPRESDTFHTRGRMFVRKRGGEYADVGNDRGICGALEMR